MENNFSPCEFDQYPVSRTVWAFLSVVAMSMLANFENFNEVGLVDVMYNGIAISLTMLILLKLFAIPFAVYSKIKLGITFKHSYYKVLKVIYFIPYGIFLVGITLFTAKLIVSYL